MAIFLHGALYGIGNAGSARVRWAGWPGQCRLSLQDTPPVYPCRLDRGIPAAPRSWSKMRHRPVWFSTAPDTATHYNTVRDALRSVAPLGAIKSGANPSAASDLHTCFSSTSC